MGKNDVFLKEKVLCITNRICISFSKGSINVRETANKKIISTVQIENGFKRHSIISRLMRTEPRCAVMIDENTCLISHDGTILNYRIDNNALSVEHKYDRGMKNPLCFCCVKDPRNNENEVYYGEYIWNVNRGPVAIYGRKKGQWTTEYKTSYGDWQNATGLYTADEEGNVKINISVKQTTPGTYTVKAGNTTICTYTRSDKSAKNPEEFVNVKDGYAQGGIAMYTNAKPGQKIEFNCKINKDTFVGKLEAEEIEE